MDFVDVTDARLIVDIVGGICNKKFGVSKVRIKIVSCDNWKGLTYTQGDTRKNYQSAPAHLLEVHVMDEYMVCDDDDNDWTVMMKIRVQGVESNDDADNDVNDEED